MKNLVIFGGTGMSGEMAVLHALSRDIKVRILVRDNNTIPESIKGKVDVVNGDVTKYADVERAVQGQDGVVVVLGTRSKLDPTTMMSEGTQNIVNAMKKFAIKPMSICLSSFLFMETEKVPKIMFNLHSEHLKMLEIVKQTDLEWRAVCPPHIEKEGLIGEFKFAYEKPITRMVSRQDLGKFLVDCLFDSAHIHKRIALSTIRPE